MCETRHPNIDHENMTNEILKEQIVKHLDAASFIFTDNKAPPPNLTPAIAPTPEPTTKLKVYKQIIRVKLQDRNDLWNHPHV